MKIRIAVIIVCIVLMLIVTSVIDSFNHNETDIPEKSDVIIMLGGGDTGRMEKAAELYHADYVLITPESAKIIHRLQNLLWDSVYPLMQL